MHWFVTLLSSARTSVGYELGTTVLAGHQYEPKLIKYVRRASCHVRVCSSDNHAYGRISFRAFATGAVIS